jgi:hypothetical protein
MNKATCKHYTGDFHNTSCAAGVCYASVTSGKPEEPGSAYRKPCVNWEVWNKIHATNFSESQRAEWNRRGTCDKFELPTQSEIDAFDAEMEAHFKKTVIVNDFIQPMRDKNKGQGYRETATCPVCKGKLHVSISGYNGHARVLCETDGCVKWIE